MRAAHMASSWLPWREGGRERGREGGREGRREGGRENRANSHSPLIHLLPVDYYTERFPAPGGKTEIRCYKFRYRAQNIITDSDPLSPSSTISSSQPRY
jgi:hypothetical protein